jgi:hypothetical protein
MDFVIVLVILALVVVFVSGPFRRVSEAGAVPATGAGPATAASPSVASEVAELEAAREAKYREIRDADLDHRTGKLSDADFQAIDGTLRGEAIEILHQLDSISKR